MGNSFVRKLLKSLLFSVPAPLVLGFLINTLGSNETGIRFVVDGNSQNFVSFLGTGFGFGVYLLSVVVFLVPLWLVQGAAAADTSGASYDTEEDDVSEDDGRESGVVKWFNVSKGFGFITRENGEDIFVHFRSIRGSGHRSLKQGQKVRFSVSQGEKGDQADNVSVIR